MEYLKLFFAFLFTIFALRSLVRSEKEAYGIKLGVFITFLIAAELAGAVYLALSVIKPYCN